jgi:hypothetical protein
MAYAVQAKDAVRAADVLSALFADYPVFRYVVPEGAARNRKLAHLFRFLVRLGLANGEVIAPSDHI